MSTPYTTSVLLPEHLKPYTRPKIIVVRLFFTPHLWYAGILADHYFEGTSLIVDLSDSVRFERQVHKDIWFPGHSLINIANDRAIQGTRNKVQRFTITEAQAITHPHFTEDNGMIGIVHAEGFTHLSYRGPDVISIEKLLEIAR